MIADHRSSCSYMLLTHSKVGVIFTGGEDGKIKASKVSANIPETSTKSKSKKHSKSDESRFKPY